MTTNTVSKFFRSEIASEIEFVRMDKPEPEEGIGRLPVMWIDSTLKQIGSVALATFFAFAPVGLGSTWLSASGIAGQEMVSHREVGQLPDFAKAQDLQGFSRLVLLKSPKIDFVDDLS